MTHERHLAEKRFDDYLTGLDDLVSYWQSTLPTETEAQTLDALMACVADDDDEGHLSQLPPYGPSISQA